MRQERFKMEREGLVEEGQEVAISERSAALYCNVRNLSYKAEDQILKGRDPKDRKDRERLLPACGNG